MCQYIKTRAVGSVVHGDDHLWLNQINSLFRLDMIDGVGICALKKTRRGLLYMDKIHTKHDTMLDINNVNILCQRLAQLDEKAV